jgi:hypothetical protein
VGNGDDPFMNGKGDPSITIEMVDGEPIEVRNLTFDLNLIVLSIHASVARSQCLTMRRIKQWPLSGLSRLFGRLEQLVDLGGSQIQSAALSPGVKFQSALSSFF